MPPGQARVVTYSEYAKHRTDAGDRYDYPNQGSYASHMGDTLLKGYIFSVDMVPTAGSMTPTAVNQSSQPYMMLAKKVDAQYYKQFQFNPPTLQMATAFAATDPVASMNTVGATVNGVVGMGIMSCSLELLFIRESETMRATTSGKHSSGKYHGMSDTELAVYAAIGVQKDIYDLYRVILANKDAAIDPTLLLPDDMTLSALSGRAFDLALAGSQLRGRYVGIMLSPELVIYGIVSALNMVYKRFNSNFVPIHAEVNISLDVTNVRPTPSQAAISSATLQSTLTNPTGTVTPSATPYSGGNSPPSRTVDGSGFGGVSQTATLPFTPQAPVVVVPGGPLVNPPLTTPWNPWGSPWSFSNGQVLG